jgi:hypothetical protein
MRMSLGFRVAYPLNPGALQFYPCPTRIYGFLHMEPHEKLGVGQKPELKMFGPVKLKIQQNSCVTEAVKV